MKSVSKWCSLFLLTTSLTSLTSFNAFSSDVQVKGLFKNAAFLQAGGESFLLKKGKSKNGVKLISSNAKSAILLVNGEEVELKLHQSIGANYAKAKSREVSIKKGFGNHYNVKGSINGKVVSFLVDTGATKIAMSEDDARLIGIKYRLDGRKAIAVTASGEAASWTVKLKSVKVGELELTNVDAMVIQGSYPETILLGMSFLSKVEMAEKNSVLVLKQTY